MRVISSVVPPSGWHYQQPLVSSPQKPRSQRIDAQTYDSLLATVLQFRLANLEMVKPGSATPEIVLQDIQFFLCGKFPHNCTGSRAQFATLSEGKWPGKTQKPSYRRPLTQIEDWITRLTTAELTWVDQQQALERAKICVQCPMNVAWRTGCGACNDNAVRRAALIRGSHATGLENKLKYCAAYGALNELAVWIQSEGSPQPRRTPPAACWKVQK